MNPSPQPAFFVRMFSPCFAPQVEAGTKLQTVRPRPRRMPRPGDTISLRCWTGQPYRSKQRVLRAATVSSVRQLTITTTGQLELDGVYLTTRGMESFAQADGFPDHEALLAWFRTTHGLPFHGIVIAWNNSDQTAATDATK